MTSPPHPHRFPGEAGESVYQRGYKLGYLQNNRVYINNHLRLVLSYHTDDDVNFRVVRFEVETASVDLAQLKVRS